MKRDFPPLFLSLFLAQKKLLFFAHEIICIKKIKRPRNQSRPSESVYGDYLLFRDVAIQVPSAMKSLTAVFGMGTGGSSSLLPPYWLYHISFEMKYTYFFECSF